MIDGNDIPDCRNRVSGCECAQGEQWHLPDASLNTFQSKRSREYCDIICLTIKIDYRNDGYGNHTKAGKCREIYNREAEQQDFPPFTANRKTNPDDSHHRAQAGRQDDAGLGICPERRLSTFVSRKAVISVWNISEIGSALLPVMGDIRFFETSSPIWISPAGALP